MENKRLQDVDIDSLTSIEDKLKTTFQKILIAQDAMLADLNIPQEDINKVIKRLEEDKISISLISGDKNNKDADEIFTENRYVQGYFKKAPNKESKDIIAVRKELDPETCIRTLAHEFQHAVGSCIRDKGLRIANTYRWVDEALTEQVSAESLKIQPTTYRVEREILQEITEAEEFTEQDLRDLKKVYITQDSFKLMEMLDSTKLRSIENVVKEITTPTMSLNVEEEKIRMDNLQAKVDSIIDETILKKQSSKMKDFLGIYNFKDRKKKYQEALESSPNFTSEKNQSIQKQMLKDIGNKVAEKEKNPEKAIAKFIKTIQSDKEYETDFLEDEGKLNILKEITRIKSIFGVDVKKEIKNLSEIEAKINIQDNSRVEIDQKTSELKVINSYITKENVDKTFVYGEELLRGDFTKGEDKEEYAYGKEITFYPNGMVKKIEANSRKMLLKIDLTNEEDAEEYKQLICSSIQEIKESKEKTADKKRIADELLNKQFDEIVPKPKNRNKKTHIKALAESKEEAPAQKFSHSKMPEASKIYENPANNVDKIVEVYKKINALDKTEDLSQVIFEAKKTNEKSASRGR
ncbi:MAG: hypothetical protein RR988_01225 [Clostridia bacterium]